MRLAIKPRHRLVPPEPLCASRVIPMPMLPKRQPRLFRIRMKVMPVRCVARYATKNIRQVKTIACNAMPPVTNSSLRCPKSFSLILCFSSGSQKLRVETARVFESFFSSLFKRLVYPRQRSEVGNGMSKKRFYIRPIWCAVCTQRYGNEDIGIDWNSYAFLLLNSLMSAITSSSEVRPVR